MEAFQPVVTKAGGQITTEIAPLAAYYYAEDYHQQYLQVTNPNGYCNHGPNGMTCPIGVAEGDA